MIAIKRIGNSKSPTVQQMRDMADNLRKRLNMSTSIDIQCWAHDHDKETEVEYRISVVTRSRCAHYFITPSWPEVIAEYRRLMKGGKLYAHKTLNTEIILR